MKLVFNALIFVFFPGTHSLPGEWGVWACWFWGSLVILCMTVFTSLNAALKVQCSLKQCRPIVGPCRQAIRISVQDCHSAWKWVGTESYLKHPQTTTVKESCAENKAITPWKTKRSHCNKRIVEKSSRGTVSTGLYCPKQTRESNWQPCHVLSSFS